MKRRYSGIQTPCGIGSKKSSPTGRQLPPGDAVVKGATNCLEINWVRGQSAMNKGWWGSYLMDTDSIARRLIAWKALESTAADGRKQCDPLVSVQNRVPLGCETVDHDELHIING